MNLAVLYGLRTLADNVECPTEQNTSVSRAEPESALQQKIDDFESELQNAYNALSPEQQDKVEAKVEEVRDFVRDQIRRDVHEVAQEHLRQGDAAVVISGPGGGIYHDHQSGQLNDSDYIRVPPPGVTLKGPLNFSAAARRPLPAYGTGRGYAQRHPAQTPSYIPLSN